MFHIGDIKVNCLDYILIVDRNFSVLFNTRYDPRVSDSSSGYKKSEYLNKNFFEIYPNIERETSSIVECLSLGRVVIRKFQKYVDFKNKVFFTHNITVPIIHGGHILGAVELVKDITPIDGAGTSGLEAQSREFDAIASSIKRDIERISFDEIITRNEYMRKNIALAKRYATTPNPTLIYGETGTGKELFAQAMIQYSGVPRKSVVIQNCAAVPENLFESILFGTVRGAYTGAENKKGLFDEADNGILFLDELNAMPYSVQGKLLRVLQDGSFRPVGAGSERFVKVKVIAAINVDPDKAIATKVLRDDLFYRFSSSMIHLLPLRDRKEDIACYVEHYLGEFSRIYGKRISSISPEFRDFLETYSWDGNVRELKHLIESMVCTAEGSVLELHHMPAYMSARVRGRARDVEPEEGMGLAGISRSDGTSLNLTENLERTERDLIAKALLACKGNKTKASVLLGIPRQTLRYKMDRLKIVGFESLD